MSDGRVTSRGPFVHSSVRATWEIEHRWGPVFGDVHRYTVTKNPGNGRVPVTITGIHKDTSLPIDVARKICEALIAAVEWTGEEDDEATTESGVALDTSKVTRVEVINENGRVFVQGPDPQMESLVEVVLQDDERTLKVFIRFAEHGDDLSDDEREQLDRTRQRIRDGEGRELADDESPNDFLTAQTRSNDGETLVWETIAEAFEHAEQNNRVWKISFNDTDGRRVRLVRVDAIAGGEPVWAYRPMEREVAEGLEHKLSDQEVDEW